MSITPELVRDLRVKSGAGMMDCKKALIESNGDMNKAQEILRKWGLATVSKRSGRAASEGMIGYKVDAKNGHGVMVEVNCETDFVARNDEFKNFVKVLADLIEQKSFTDLNSLMASNINNQTVEDALNNLTAKIGEKMTIRRFAKEKINGKQKISQYIHAGEKIGVIVTFDDPNGKLENEIAREVAMHVAAMRPRYVRSTDVPKDELAKEREIIEAQMKDEKKPPEILAKIVDGKLKKYFSEACLEDQIFVRDPEGKSSVGKWLTKIDPAIKIEKFVRFEVGEGV